MYRNYKPFGTKNGACRKLWDHSPCRELEGPVEIFGKGKDTTEGRVCLYIRLISKLDLKIRFSSVNLDRHRLQRITHDSKDRFHESQWHNQEKWLPVAPPDAVDTEYGEYYNDRALYVSKASQDGSYRDSREKPK